MFCRKKILSTLFALTLTTNAFALNLQGYRFSDSYRYSILDDSLHEKFEGKYVLTASYSNLHSPFYYSDRSLNDLRGEIIKFNNIFTAGFSYYLNKNVSFGIDANFMNNEVFGDTYNELADTILKSRINIRRTKTFSLSLNPQIYLPTGNTDNFSTVDAVSGALSLVAEKSMNRFHLLGSVGGFSGKNNNYLDVDHRQLLLTQLGISYDLMDSWNLNFETFRNFPTVNDKLQDEGRYFLTAKHKTHQNFSTYFGAGVTGWDQVERNTYGFFVGLKFHEKAQKMPEVSTPTPVAYQDEPIRLGQAAPVRPELPKFEDVYFGHALYNLDATELLKLDEVVEYFNQYRQNIQQIVIGGYASAVGSRVFNKKLSLKRAGSAKTYLVEKGLPAEKLSVESYGEDFAQDADEAKNRKVHLKITQEE